MPEPRRREFLELFPTKDELAFFDWPLEKMAYCFVWTLLPLCLFWLLIDKWEPYYPHSREELWNRCRANFVLAWLVVLVGLWLMNPSSQFLKIVFGVIAGWRLFEIFVTGMGTMLDQRQQIRARNVVTILIYAIQVTFIFAVLYYSFASAGFSHHPHRPSDYLYMSWSAMTSIGNDAFSPETTVARFLEIGAAASSIFLLSVLLAYTIDALKCKTHN